MTGTEGISDADTELRDAIRSIDAIGEGASGHGGTPSKHGGAAGEASGRDPGGEKSSGASA